MSMSEAEFLHAPLMSHSRARTVSHDSSDHADETAYFAIYAPGRSKPDSRRVTCAMLAFLARWREAAIATASSPSSKYSHSAAARRRCRPRRRSRRRFGRRLVGGSVGRFGGVTVRRRRRRLFTGGAEIARMLGAGARRRDDYCHRLRICAVRLRNHRPPRYLRSSPATSEACGDGRGALPGLLAGRF